MLAKDAFLEVVRMRAENALREYGASFHNTAADRIAEALTEHTPLSAAHLQEFGFKPPVQHSNAGYQNLVLHIGEWEIWTKVRGNVFSDFSVLRVQPTGIWESGTVYPRLETVGDLYFLAWRLSRTCAQPAATS